MTPNLERVAAELADKWNLQLGDRLTGGTFALVYAAVDTNGDNRVLKINPPDVETAGTYESERDVLLAAGGRGYVRLYDHDDTNRAFLLERLGKQMAQSASSVDDWVRQLADLLVDTWAACDIPRPESVMTAAEKCEWFLDYLDRAWREQNEPCPRPVIDEAMRFAELRGAAYDASKSVVLHGDAHAWNALESAEGGYKLIDPDPYFGEREADLSVPMREWNAEMLATGDGLAAVRLRTATLAGITGTDADAIWQWGFIERVASALVCNAEGTVDWARDAFALAEACVGVGPS